MKETKETKPETKSHSDASKGVWADPIKRAKIIKAMQESMAKKKLALEATSEPKKKTAKPRRTYSESKAK